MTRVFHIIRLVLMMVLAVLWFSEPSGLVDSLWWLTMGLLGVWALCCFWGLLVFLPLFVLILALTAGGAQADWMSDSFLFWTCIVLPTFLSMAIGEVFRWRSVRGYRVDASK